MTEQEWLASNHPVPMQVFISSHASTRKWRLLACAYVRSIWHLLGHEASRTAVEVSERFADGVASRDAIVQATNNAFLAVDAVGRKGEPLNVAALAAYEAAEGNTDVA